MQNRRATQLPRPLAPAGQETAQAIWSGTISFSLVAIPVQLVRAVEPGRVSFRLLHGKDHSPLLRRMVCPKEGKIVPPGEIVRGYEIGPDKYILVSDGELESVSPERSRTIEIVEFIDMAEVDPLYYDHPYYLLPAKGGEKAYRLLVEVMRRTGKAGLAKFVLAEREHLVAITSRGGALCLITLHYSDEILPAGAGAPAREAVEPREAERLKQTIAAMRADFVPARYADGRRQKILRLLRRKVKEQAPVEAPAIEGEAGEAPPDLIAALEESMRALKKGRR